MAEAAEVDLLGALTASSPAIDAPATAGKPHARSNTAPGFDSALSRALDADGVSTPAAAGDTGRDTGSVAKHNVRHSAIAEEGGADAPARTASLVQGADEAGADVADSGTTRVDGNLSPTAAMAAPPLANPPIPLERSMDALAPVFRSRLERVIERMRDELGLEVRVVETWRSQGRQDALFAQGRTVNGPTVTWTRQSNHTRGIAADVIVGDGYADASAYAHLATIAAEEGLGTLAGDPGHVELRDPSALARVRPRLPNGSETEGARRGPVLPGHVVALIADIARPARTAALAETAAPARIAGGPAPARGARLAGSAAIAKPAETAGAATIARPPRSATPPRVVDITMMATPTSPAQPATPPFVATPASPALMPPLSEIATVAPLAEPARPVITIPVAPVLGALDGHASTSETVLRATTIPGGRSGPGFDTPVEHGPDVIPSSTASQIPLVRSAGESVMESVSASRAVRASAMSRSPGHGADDSVRGTGSSNALSPIDGIADDEPAPDGPDSGATAGRGPAVKAVPVNSGFSGATTGIGTSESSRTASLRVSGPPSPVNLDSRIARALAIRDAAEAAPASGVTLMLDGVEGVAARIRLDLRGAVVSTSIDVADPLAAVDFGRRAGELQRALAMQGLQASPVIVRQAASLHETADAARVMAASLGAEIAGPNSRSMDNSGTFAQQHRSPGSPRRDNESPEHHQKRQSKEERT